MVEGRSNGSLSVVSRYRTLRAVNIAHRGADRERVPLLSQNTRPKTAWPPDAAAPEHGSIPTLTTGRQADVREPGDGQPRPAPAVRRTRWCGHGAACRREPDRPRCANRLRGRAASTR